MNINSFTKTTRFGFVFEYNDVYQNESKNEQIKEMGKEIERKKRRYVARG